MIKEKLNEYTEDYRLVRSETLARLRWLAIIGQFLTVIIVYKGFGYSLPLWPCFFVIALSAAVNIILQRLKGRWLNDLSATCVLAFDALQFSALVYLTGGLTNPFAMMSLGPVMIAASILSARKSTIIGVLVIFCSAFLIRYHYPLPWNAQEPLNPPFLYVVALWLAIVVTVVFVGSYAWSVAQEGRQLARALSATELVLNREQHLLQLDGLAAAAAHELGTPLGTIALIAKELSKSAPEGSETEEDLALLREQVDRCRCILLKMTSFKEQQQDFFEQVSLLQLLAEIIQNIHGSDISIQICRDGDEPEPLCQRNPGIAYGLTNFLNNAVDFAKKSVQVYAKWDNSSVSIDIKDDGPGFHAEILHHIGKPYVTSRKRDQNTPSQQGGGLGLGLFISKTLLERTGARLSFTNDTAPHSGAIVRIEWSRSDFERSS